MSKRSVGRDPVGTIRRDNTTGSLFYAIRWNESSDMGWRVVNVIAGGDYLASDADMRHWVVLYRPAMAQAQL